MARRKEPKNELHTRPSACVACGKAATGYNYDAPSCSSCRTFFRRTVITNQVFHGCSKLGVCERNESVQLCRSCRYLRCVNGGMNPTSVKHPGSEVLNDGATVENGKRRRRRKIVHSEKANIRTEKSGETNDGNCKPQAEPELRMVKSPLRIEEQLESMMYDLLRIEKAHQKLRISRYTPMLCDGLSIDHFLPGPSKLGMNFEPMSAQPYKPISVRLVPMEILIKCRLVLDFTNFDYGSKKLWQFQDVVYSIEFIKALPIYHQLDDHSRRVLLASALTCANYTSAFYSYSHHSDRTCYPDGIVMTWNSEMHKQSPDSTRFYTGLIAAMKEVQLDTREYALLKIIIICNPLLAGLHPSDITLLQQERKRCTNTLLSYVLARRGVEKGPAYFAKILSIADLAMRLTNWLKCKGMLMLALDLFKNRSPFVETMYHSH